MQFVARTHTGKVRAENQDSVCVFAAAGFAVGIVADGMGGHKGGSLASSETLSCVKDCLLKSLKADSDQKAVLAVLQDAYSLATKRIYALAQERCLDGMGTTLTVCLLRGGEATVAQIGDSRAYAVDGEGITQITKDQTLVQSLIDSGEITPEAAKSHPMRHVILEAVGTVTSIEPQLTCFSVTGQTILLCSDGLTNMVSDADIQKTVLEAATLAQAADTLVGMANAAGGEDNITVALLRG